MAKTRRQRLTIKFYKKTKQKSTETHESLRQTYGGQRYRMYKFRGGWKILRWTKKTWMMTATLVPKLGEGKCKCVYQTSDCYVRTSVVPFNFTNIIRLLLSYTIPFFSYIFPFHNILLLSLKKFTLIVFLVFAFCRSGRAAAHPTRPHMKVHPDFILCIYD